MDPFYQGQEGGDTVSEYVGPQISDEELASIVAAYHRLGDREFVLGLTDARLDYPDFELAWKMRQAVARDESGQGLELLWNAKVVVTS